MKLLRKPLRWGSYAFLWAAFSAVSLTAAAGHSGSILNSKSKTFKTSDVCFTENKGQLKDGEQQPLAQVKYYLNQNGTGIYFKPGMLSIVFSRTLPDLNTSEATGRRICKQRERTVQTERMDLTLVGASPAAYIYGADIQSYYENFYNTGDANNGIKHVNTYKKVIYANVYPHIDMVFEKTGPACIEYSFIVHPGGHVQDIKLHWDGAGQQAIQNGRSGFRYKNSLGTISESTPAAFAGKMRVSCTFTSKKGFYGFIAGKYDKNHDLVIDPSLTWSSYYGGSTDENQNNGGGLSEAPLTTDGSGNVYMGGTTGTSGLGTSGTYLSTYQGNQDGIIIQFSSTGGRNWCTYFGGGGGNDYMKGLAYDATSTNLYFVGDGNSGGLATSGTYRTAGGGYDMFAGMLTNDGATLLHCTYYGSINIDLASGIAVAPDGTGKFYITGDAEGSGMSTSGSYQSTYGGGGDACLAKFTSDCHIIWATYLGGSNNDIGFGIAADASNVYITGNSHNNGLATSGVYQTSNKNTSNGNAFLAAFDSGGTVQGITYYGGTSTESGYSVAAANSKVYITGVSTSSGLATTGVYQTSQAGSNDAYIACFNTSLTSLSWSSYFGTSSNDYGLYLKANSSGAIYLEGITGSSSGLATTGAYQTSNAGGYDVFLAEFNGSSGKLNGATYFGGSGNEYPSSIALDGSDNVYFSGYTSSTSGIASGGYQTANAGSNDLFVAGFGPTDLPVTFTDFKVSLINSEAFLQWQTANEINNDYFEIQRSADGINWTPTGKVAGHGTTKTANSYTATDRLQGLAPAGTLYYRLKQVDYNGSSQYSVIRQIKPGQQAPDISIYPNPATHMIYVNCAGAATGATLTLTGINGVNVYSKILDNTSQQQIDISRLAPGCYYLKLMSGSKELISKAVYKN